MCGSKSKINCQCDGNCQCGEILPNGEISCHNCGWKAEKAYNALTGNFVCPSCRTESSYSNNVKPKNNTMNAMNNTENFSQGLVGLAAVNPGFLNWSKNPVGGKNGTSNESGYATFPKNVSSQASVGYGIGQDWALLDPFGRRGVGESNFSNSDDDKKWAELFYNATAEFDAAENSEESGLTFGEKVKSAFTRFTPAGVVIRASWVNKYCKALGYMKSADKNGFKKCVAATKINFVNAKSGKWKYPPAPEGKESEISLEELAAESAKEAASMPPAQKEAVYRNEAAEAGVTSPVQPQKSNALLYMIIGIVVLAIIIAIFIMMRKKSAPAA